jgi:hypothetical protein
VCVYRALSCVCLQGSELYVFACDRWLARDEDDHAIERELVPTEVIEETLKRDGSVKKKNITKKNSLISE